MSKNTPITTRAPSGADALIDRRSACALLVGGLLSGCTTGVPGGPRAAAQSLTVYSPAPPSTPLHALNLQLVEAAKSAALPVPMDMPAVALPESLETISALSAADKPFHLPIITTIDWAFAKRGSGPDWHGYPEPYDDMRMVTSLYDVGFGIQMFDADSRTPDSLRGKRIGVPPRPSAVRLQSELLLRDGWGIIDDVELVDMMPGDMMAAVATGRIDGTSWNLILPGQGGPAPMLARMPLPAASGYVPVEQAALDRINGANGLPLTLWRVGGGSYLNFAQGLAAWRDTPDAVVDSVLDAVLASDGAAGLPQNVGNAFAWPITGEVAWHGAATRRRAA